MSKHVGKHLFRNNLRKKITKLKYFVRQIFIQQTVFLSLPLNVTIHIRVVMLSVIMLLFMNG